jgi:AhpD family alkylhydroperoxidase
MKKRIAINDLEPEAYKAMMGLEAYIEKSSIGIKLVEIIKLRASQINGCAYCIEMHSEIALQHGETQNCLFSICAWKESTLFSEKERVALAITEDITLISKDGLRDETYNNAKKCFSDNEIAQIIMIIGTINVWNRIAVSTHMIYEK